MSKIVLNSSGVKALLRSQEMQTVCNEHAKAAVNKLGEGYSTESYIGKTRVNAAVVATTAAAVRENLKSNTVLKAIK